MSGNPLGRPKMLEAVKEAKALASRGSPEIVRELQQAIGNKRYRLSDRLRAAELILRAAGAFDDAPVTGIGRVVVVYADARPGARVE